MVLNGAPILQVEGLGKVYGELRAVAGLSFELRLGEVLGLVGPNGAGKTTTLRCLAGIIPPTSGRVVVGGSDLQGQPVPAKRALAFLPDEPRLFDYLTVREHLNLIGFLHEPQLILLDEPLTGLDPLGIRRMKQSLRLRAERGAAVVLSSHLLPLVEELCHRILVIAGGRNVALGSLEEIRSRLSGTGEPHPGARESLEDLFIRITAKGEVAGGEKP